jgi:hypothetical protein
MMRVFTLPLPVYGIIRDFLIDYRDTPFRWKFSPQIKNWRNFLNSMKNDENVMCIKKQWNYFVLAGRKIEIWLKHYFPDLQFDGKSFIDERISRLVHDEIENPRNQLAICMNIDWSPVFTMGDIVAYLSTVNMNIHFFALEYSSSVNAAFLKNVSYVNLYGCYLIQDISCFESSSCIFLNLSNTGKVVTNRNVHFLRKIKRLYLNYCEEITDVSNLSDVYELSLCYNKDITDISSLGRVYKLNLRGCTGITDLSLLTHVRILDICNISDIQNGLSIMNVIEKISVTVASMKQLDFVKSDTDINIFREIGAEVNLSRFENLSFNSAFHSPWSIDHNTGLSVTIPSVKNLFMHGGKLVNCAITGLKYLISLYMERVNMEFRDPPVKVDFSMLPVLETAYFKECFLDCLEIRGKYLKKVTLIHMNRYKTVYLIKIFCILERFEIQLRSQKSPLVVEVYNQDVPNLTKEVFSQFTQCSPVDLVDIRFI